MTNIVVGIATAGRADILQITLSYVAQQTRLPNRIVICPAVPADAVIDPDFAASLNIEIIIGNKGLTSQRNAIIDHVASSDVLVFFDDDFLPDRNYIHEVERLFTLHSEIVVATGLVLADGILTPGLSETEAANIISASGVHKDSEILEHVYNAYGCNMIIRLAPVIQNSIRFDVELPLYGWLEDLDFSRQLAPYGKIVKSNQLKGVHMGVKRGRNSGVKFGYSQVANPLYLVRKHSLSPHRALAQVSRNVAMNTMKLKAPEPWIDRRGRLKGNLMAFGDLLRGRITPHRIIELE